MTTEHASVLSTRSGDRCVMGTKNRRRGWYPRPAATGPNVCTAGRVFPSGPRPVPYAGGMPGVPPADVPDNDWRRLEPSVIGSWDPSRSVSLIIPFYEDHDELRLTMAALAEQTYPPELTEIVVVDDGSASPPEVSELGSFVRVVRQERRGFGLARARNLGVAESEGEILVFLDADMVPARRFLEAHARWHHVASDVVAVGPREHVEMSDLSPGQVADAVERDGWDDLLRGRRRRTPPWITRHLRTTDQLTRDRGDLYRVMSGGNLSMRRELFVETGGVDGSFDEWGGEDTEFGYRLVTAGAVVVPEPAALCRHQGEGGWRSPPGNRARRVARLAELVPDPRYRPRTDRAYRVPSVVVFVHGGGDGDAVPTVASVLDSDLEDVVVVCDSPGALAPDPAGTGRLFSTTDAPVAVRSAWAHAVVPAGVVVPPDLLSLMLDRLRSEPLRTLGVAAGDGAPTVNMAATRQLNRSRRRRGGSVGWPPREEDWAGVGVSLRIDLRRLRRGRVRRLLRRVTRSLRRRGVRARVRSMFRLPRS